MPSLALIRATLAAALSVTPFVLLANAIDQGSSSAIEQKSNPVTETDTKAAARASYEQAIRLNGPTGWAVTDTGKHRFVRLGTATRRHLLSFGGIDPKDIASVTWANPCCDVAVELRNGDVKTINVSDIMELSYDNHGRVWSSYGVSPGFPIIIRNMKSGVDSERYFPNFESLRSLHFDLPSLWEKGRRVAVKSAVAPAPRKQARAPVTAEAAVSVQSTAPIAFEIGTRICHRTTATTEAPLNFSYGGRQATETLSGWVTLIGFVEVISGPRIQIRIGRIAFQPEQGQRRNSLPRLIVGGNGEEQLDNFNYNDIGLKEGSIFWDRAKAWRDCE